MITNKQSDLFWSRGLLVHDDALSASEVARVLDEIAKIGFEGGTVSFESDGRTPRALHRTPGRNDFFDRLSRLRIFVEPAKQLLGEDVYVYQFKVNMKSAFNGDVWPWHQDYSFWHKEDGMPTSNAITATLFLDDVSEFNGPMYFIPGSHLSGCHDALQDNQGNDWSENVSARLNYQTDPSSIRSLVADFGIIAPKGSQGTILFFHSNIVHASPPNISPFDRRIVFITYNSVTNCPKYIRRPDFLVNPDPTPITTLESLR